jgi:hypothetical protein
MPYSSGVKVIKLVSGHLDQMVAAENNERIEWVSNDPSQLAYRLWNAMVACAKRVKEGNANEQHIAYAKLKQKYIIKKTGTTVIAEPRDITPLEAVRVSMNSRIVLEAKISAIEIVAAAIQKKEASVMEFPDADMSHENLQTIYNWAEKNDYKVILVPSPSTGIQLAHSGEGKVVWSPSYMATSENLQDEIQESTSPTSQDTISHLLGITENSTTSPKDT